MQTTLLGLGIAIILAIVAALVAPFVVSWNHYRSAFEIEASRLTGMDVHVNGNIDARILPSPVIILRNVEAGAPGREPQLRAGSIELEVGLGPLLRGKVQASQVHLVAPQLNLGLDRSGTIDWPAPSPSFHPEALSISHFDVAEGSVILTDAGSGSRLVLQKLSFDGDIRSFAGPFSGDGTFSVGDEPFSYRISGSRGDTDPGLKIRLGVAPLNHPLTADVDGMFATEHGQPTFQGTLALARPVVAALSSGKRVLSDPWHATGKIVATPGSASLQDVAFQYGPDERSLNFTGRADLTLGVQPHLTGNIAALQLDVDRALADPDATHRPPLLVIKSFLEGFVTKVKLPMAAQIGVGIAALTVGGTSLQSVRGTVRFDATGWSLDGFEFRAPGFTQVNLSGHLHESTEGLALRGPAVLHSADVDALLGWLRGRGDQHSGEAKTLSAHGDITIAGDRIAIDGLSASLDRENVDGKLAYTWPVGGEPAVLDAELRAATLDLDALAAFGKAAADNGLELPRRGSLALAIGKATSAGVDARQIDARLKFDGGALQIDRLAVGELGGAALDISGRIDELSSRPRGQITLDLDAQALAGLDNVVGKFTPRAADVLRRFADSLAPAKLHAHLTVGPAATAGSTAKLGLDGQLGLLRVSLLGEATGEPSQLGDVGLRITSRLDADDGTVLTRLFGLDRIVALDQLPASMTFSAVGPLNGDVRVDGNVAASGATGAVRGTLRLQGDNAPTGALQVLVTAADLRPLAQAMTGQPGAAVPLSARAAVAVAGSDLALTDIAVAVGKSSLRGHLKLGLAKPLAVNGDIEGDDMDAAGVAALLLGLPRVAPGAGGLWSSDPDGPGAFTAASGAVTFKLARAALTPSLVAPALTGVLRLHPSEMALDNVQGELAGGRVTGSMAVSRNAGVVNGHGHLALAGADAATLLGLDGEAVDAKVTLDLQGTGIGSNPIELVRSLNGAGTIAFADGHFASLDATAFATAMHAADSGDVIEAPKIQAAVTAAMANGRLLVQQGAAPMTLTGGMLDVISAALKTQDGSDLSLSGRLDLSNAAINARATLIGHPGASALIRIPPELAVTFKGPLASPQRTLDTAALTGWLTLRAAEMQARRLESLQANQRPEVIGAASRPDSPPVRTAPPAVVIEMPAIAPLAPAPGAHGFERLHPEPAAAAKPIDGVPRVDANAAPGATADQKPRPLVQPSAAQSTAKPSSPQTAVPRSPLDWLFRSQN